MAGDFLFIVSDRQEFLRAFSGRVPSIFHN